MDSSSVVLNVKKHWHWLEDKLLESCFSAYFYKSAWESQIFSRCVRRSQSWCWWGKERLGWAGESSYCLIHGALNQSVLPTFGNICRYFCYVWECSALKSPSESQQQPAIYPQREGKKNGMLFSWGREWRREEVPGWLWKIVKTVSAEPKIPKLKAVE